MGLKECNMSWRKVFYRRNQTQVSGLQALPTELALIDLKLGKTHYTQELSCTIFLQDAVVLLIWD